MPKTSHIAIIGGGFCGAITAVNLIRSTKNPLKITLIHSGTPFIRGVAYSAYSSTHLLNVVAGNMSAFPDDADHFINWLYSKDEYSSYQKDLLERTFIPRRLYGDYLCTIWETTLTTKKNNIEVTVIDDYVTDIEFPPNSPVKISIEKGIPISADYVVLAMGNSLPRDPSIANTIYYLSPTYYKNPWQVDSVNNLKPDGDILLIGNGLTMADTVAGLIEQGFKNKIYSISNNGFGILPHKDFNIQYTGLMEEIGNNFNLNRLVGIVIKHIKKAIKLGISAGPVIDSLRPYSQQIWQSFTIEEKKQFLSRYRHMWGVARHRLPPSTYDTIEKLRINGSLEIYAGSLLNIIEKENNVLVTFYNARKRCTKTCNVQRVINCTGPETSIRRTLNPLLHRLAEKNIISSDPFELGINADISTYTILIPGCKKDSIFFTLGTLLKGLLWETIAVPELRIQCQQLSNILLETCKKNK